MNSLPVEVLVGLSSGLLIGTVPSFVVGLCSFGAGHYGEYVVPQWIAIGIALPVAAANGYALGVLDPAVGAAQAPRLLVAAFVVVMFALYANSQGEKIAARIPRDLARATRNERTLSEEAVEAVDGTGQMTIHPSGDVEDVDGHPPLPPAVRSAIEDDTWRLPADLPLPELEARLEDRLRTEYDLASVSASIDARGRAAIAAAPPAKDLARRIPEGMRAVTLNALLPTGLAPGDDVVVGSPAGTVDGKVLSVTTDGGERATAVTGHRRDHDETAGGPGRVTVAVETAEARPLLESDRGRVAANSHGTNHAYESFGLLDRAGKTVRKLRLGERNVAALVDDDGAEVVAVRRPGAEGRQPGWTVDADQETVESGVEAFVVGDPGATALTPRATSDGGDSL